MGFMKRKNNHKKLNGQNSNGNGNLELDFDIHESHPENGVSIDDLGRPSDFANPVETWDDLENLDGMMNSLDLDHNEGEGDWETMKRKVKELGIDAINAEEKEWATDRPGDNITDDDIKLDPWLPIGSDMITSAIELWDN